MSQRSRSHNSKAHSSKKKSPPSIQSNELGSSTKLNLLRKNDSDENRSKHSSHRKDYITLGICAMKKKVQSKPMKQILSRLSTCKQIKILQMWDCLDRPYDTWPKVEAMICFHSQGFPFVQAWRYVKKHKPFLINNLDKQQLLWDRTVVYDILKKIRVPVAKHYMIFRDKKYIEGLQLRGNGPIFQQNEDQQYSQSSMKIKKFNYDNSRNDLSPVDQILKKKSMSYNQLKQYSSQQRLKTLQSEQKQISQGQIKLLYPIRTSQKDIIQNPKQLSSQKQNTQRNQSKSLNNKKNNKSNNQLLQNIQVNLQQKKLHHQSPPSHLQVEQRKRESLQKSVSKRSAFRKRTEIDIIEPESRFPNTLKNFHQSRQKNIQDYTVQQIDDGIIIKSSKTQKVHKLKKPFVQKPFDAQNHHICIYYPQSMGGGRKMLFRKVKNTSSEYQQEENKIRTDGNYIYEEFLMTNAFDIKVYTIGPYYMYAQARRSPTLDGVVDRDQTGKEKRFPVILTPQEKFLCSKIVQEFQQDICGFDLLRAEGKSYVCDVNGWSFVKGNPKYWDDCAVILKRKILKKFFPHLLISQTSKYERFTNNQKNQFRPPMSRLKIKNEQLRSIVSIFRHGDRSPKLKMKTKTSDARFLQFFKTTKQDEVKIKDPKSLIKILHITNQIITQMDDKKPEFKDFNQLKSVLESGGRFEGLNRKIQMKVIERQTSPDSQGNYPVKKILIVLKWGGELSYSGYLDSLELGKKMRQQRYDDDHDFLSLFSSYKHDLKTYSSDQGRCIKTAAAFLKGFLNISGDGLAPIITSMVNFGKKAQKLLDCSSQQNHSELSQQIKQNLQIMMNSEQQLLQSFLKHTNEGQICQTLMKVIKQIGNPLDKLHKMNVEIQKLVNALQLKQMEHYQDEEDSNVQSHQDQQPESLIIIYKRWLKLQKDFYDSQTKKFNISKIPEIYDNIRYDEKKNHHVFEKLEFKSQCLRYFAKILAHFVVPNQYGMNDREKLQTALDIVSPLLQKIIVDLMFWKNKEYEDLYWKYKQTSHQGQEAEEEDNWKHIRTRLYFTSASHMYSIINVICLGNQRELLKSTPKQQAQKALNQLYMSYLSHIQFRLYENMVSQQNDPNRFRLQISISSQFKNNKPLKQFFLGGSQGFTIEKIQRFIQKILMQKKRDSSTNLEKNYRLSSREDDE